MKAILVLETKEVLYGQGIGVSGLTCGEIIFNTGMTIIAATVLLAIIYFAQTSFALIPAQQTFKNTFAYGVKYARTILPAFIINIIISGITNILPFIWFKTIPILSIAIIILITIPAMAFARLHMIIAVWPKR